MIVSDAIMFNIPNLVSVGIGADYKLFGVPMALIALLSTAFFLTGLCARSAGAIGNIAAPLVDRLSVWWSLSRLDREAKAILCVFEEDGLTSFYYPPDDDHLSALRDRGLVLPNLVGDRRDWGVYHVGHQFERSMRRYRGMVRRLLRVDPELVDGVRRKSASANRAASRRV